MSRARPHTLFRAFRLYVFDSAERVAALLGHLRFYDLDYVGDAQVFHKICCFFEMDGFAINKPFPGRWVRSTCIYGRFTISFSSTLRPY